MNLEEEKSRITLYLCVCPRRRICRLLSLAGCLMPGILDPGDDESFVSAVWDNACVINGEKHLGGEVRRKREGSSCLHLAADLEQIAAHGAASAQTNA
jgi:hypothetical protein